MLQQWKAHSLRNIANYLVCLNTYVYNSVVRYYIQQFLSSRKIYLLASMQILKHSVHPALGSKQIRLQNTQSM